MTLVMRDRVSIARRLATDLPLWAVARGCDMPLEELGHLMWEASFRELLAAWQGVFALPVDKRLARLEKLAHFVLEDALGRNDMRAAMFVERERHRQRDPVVSLARSFSNIVEHDKAKAERLREQIAAREAAAQAAEAPPAPEPDPIAMAKAAAAIRPKAHPSDRAVWAKAAQLRRGMFDEQLLHHAVEAQAEREARSVPLDLDELWAGHPEKMEEAEEPEAVEVTAEPAAPTPEPAPEADPAPRSGDDGLSAADLTGEAAAEAALRATLASLPPEIRQVLETFSQEEMDNLLWALADGTFPGLRGEALPQGP
jgi:hypothetical protein